MKCLIVGATILLQIALHAQDFGFRNNSEADGFDVSLFQQHLTQEMLLAFPWMTEDTTNNFAARATSQKEAGSPICYGSKQGGMVDTKNDELVEAKRLVHNYQDYLFNSPNFGEKALRKYYKDFSAVATKQYGGLIRYGLLVDNNITYESMMETSRNITNMMYQEKIDIVDSLVKQRFGPEMRIDKGFHIGCVNYVKEKTQNIKIPFAPGEAHYPIVVSSKDGLPRNETLIEIYNERFDYLESLDLPLTISRYYITTIIEGDETFLILALDN